jgi:hypothetical protein
VSAPQYAIETPARSADLVDMIAANSALVPLKLTARAQWFLEELIAAGPEGCTTLAYPGVRISDCLFKLRRAGVDVTTEYERHDGAFQGSHGRFFLRSKIVRLTEAMPTAATTEQRAAL